MQSLLGSFGTNASVDIVLPNTGRAFRSLPASEAGKQPIQTFIYSSREDLSGEVKVNVFGGKRVEHSGIRIELKGLVELTTDGGKTFQEFVSNVKELSPAGGVTGLAAFKFSFNKVELPFESYNGANARIRYFLRAIVTKSGYAGANLIKDQDFIVQNIEGPATPTPGLLTAAAAALVGSGAAAAAAASASSADGAGTSSALTPSSGQGVKLEVGIEDCLHIEFEYDKTKYHLADVVTGRVDFLLVRIKIKHMEVALIRREAAGLVGSVVANDSETLTRFEVMDGAPIKGERVPIRLHLAGLDVSPSILHGTGYGGNGLTGNNSGVVVGAASGGGGGSSAGQTLLTVRYFLNLVLVDEEDRRYFKQQEITLYRAAIKGG